MTDKFTNWVPWRSGRPRAVILGVEHPRSVAVIRSLGSEGIDVIAVDHDKSARGFYSRYVKQKVVVNGDADGAIACLEELGENGGGLLIPTNDHYLHIVGAHYDQLSRLFIVTSPPGDLLRKLMDKPQCYRLAQEAGLRTPRFSLSESVEELDRVIRTLDFNNQAYILSVRLPTSQPADVRTGRLTRAAGSDAATLRERCLDIFSRTEKLPMIAEVVPGNSKRCIGVSMVVDQTYEPVVWYCVRRLQLYPYSSNQEFVHPYELGANVYCESIHDDEAVEQAGRFVRHSKFSGVITVEFKRDATDERLTLIKVDPRVVRATSLSTRLGLDIPRTLYCVFAGRQVDNARSYPAGVAWIWLTWYLGTVWKNRFQNSLRKEFLALLRSSPRIKAFGYLSIRDPLPFLIDVLRLVKLVIRRVFSS